MDIILHSKRIDASSKKLVTLGNEYSKPKSDEITARKVLVKMFLEVAQQNTLIGEKIAQLDKNIKLKSLFYAVFDVGFWWGFIQMINPPKLLNTSNL